MFSYVFLVSISWVETTYVRGDNDANEILTAMVEVVAQQHIPISAMCGDRFATPSYA